MSAEKHNQYAENFKKFLVSLYHNGKIQSQLCKEYSVSLTAPSRWVKQYLTIETDNGDVLTAKQVQELQKYNTQLEEENLILKKTNSKWYYLCIIMDLFSRKVISRCISAKADVRLMKDAFHKAYKKRNVPYGLMFHSDRGSQYTAFAFRQLLDSLNVVQSFSKKGCPFDHACCESFFKYLKKEETDRKTYHS